MDLMESCSQCGKRISDEEWVVHWCSCAECFDKGYDNYMLGEAFVVSMGGYSSQFPEGL